MHPRTIKYILFFDSMNWNSIPILELEFELELEFYDSTYNFYATLVAAPPTLF